MLTTRLYSTNKRERNVTSRNVFQCNIVLNFDICSLQSDGLCDRRQRPCKRATVLGTQFLNSTNLTCHITEVKVIN